MKNLLTLFFVFLSFNAHSQNNETEEIRHSVILNLKLIELEELILDYELRFKNSTKYFSELKKKAFSYAKNDTLVLFSTGIIGSKSRKGAGEYDSITSKYSFFYKDLYSDCLSGFYIDTAMIFYNSIIKNEISKRYGKEWEKKCKSKIIKTQTKTNIVIGRRVDFKILINQVEIDTIFINNFEQLQTDISNEEVVNQDGKRKFVATISFVKDRKLISQYEDVHSEDIKFILMEELSKQKNKSNRIVIEFSNHYYPLGLYIYPIK